MDIKQEKQVIKNAPDNQNKNAVAPPSGDKPIPRPANSEKYVKK